MTDPNAHEAADETDAAAASTPNGPLHSARRTRVIGAAVAVLVAVLIATSALLWARSRDLDDQVAGMRHQVTQMRDGVTTFKKCVNVYMRTVGNWSSDVNSGYKYRYC
jgi:hypothetical protein